MRRSCAAFSLIELLTVIVTVAILAALLLPVIPGIQNRVEFARCSGNLRSLYYGGSAYLQDRGYWPQISGSLLASDRVAYANAWVEALSPYGISRVNWICPTNQRLMESPNIDEPKNHRTDYIAFPFGPKPNRPYQNSKDPWFVERGDFHGDGNLLILTNGSVKSLGEMGLLIK